MAQVILKAGHVQPVWAGHPWVFAQGIDRIRGDVESGAEVQVRDSHENVLGRGFYSPNSAIAVRLFTRLGDRPFNQELVAERLRAALNRRSRYGLPGSDTTGYRAFHGEGDGLPGLIVDVYGATTVLQLGTAGMYRRKEPIVRAVLEVLEPRTILDRTPAQAARAEQFELGPEHLVGDEVHQLSFLERGLRIEVPLGLTQKTGYYFDQRPLRARIQELAAGCQVLDAYSFVGGIGLSAARGGAKRVLCVDSSAPALEVGRNLAALNGLSVEWQKGDAVEVLGGFDKSWDIVVSDPPKLATTRKARDKAMKALRRIARASVHATRSGGLVSLSSCSAALGLSELERALALGARDLGRSAWILERLFQGPDHPVPVAFPEGSYLTTVIAEVE